MDPIKNMLENKEKECEVCGSKKELSKHLIPLWNYGVREVKPRLICKSCLSAHRKGEL
jgi:hypothetical protein